MKLWNMGTVKLVVNHSFLTFTLCNGDGMFEFPDSYREKGKYDFISRKDEPEIPTKLCKDYVEVCAQGAKCGSEEIPDAAKLQPHGNILHAAS